ncbi:MAG: hypothetical protein DI616_19860 [Paracoccus denitrificans]|uniref:Uncharacterized protein n=1 Tax=Paracoccus denitrificans TaxID=266 RepID=A0A533I077_PARDE|nr:MAG: hypothetical protein DI616_19860 [Paracoccus denitrificans]
MVRRFRYSRVAAAAVLLSAAMLAGCATTQPQFSYDPDVPALPTAPTTAPDNTPRPLHTPSAWRGAHGGQAAATPT